MCNFQTTRGGVIGKGIMKKINPIKFRKNRKTAQKKTGKNQWYHKMINQNIPVINNKGK